MMASPLDKLLDYLVKDGLLTRERADECLRVRSEAVEKGDPSSMTNIVVSKGGVDPARLSLALLSVKALSLLCPRCRRRHTTRQASLDVVYPCKKCGTPLEAEEVVPSGSGPVGKVEDVLPPEVVEARRDPRRIFGKYTLLQELGRGGYAVVHRAWDSLLAQDVALKLIRGEEEGSPGEARAGEAEILREARLAARLQHPNIVRIWEVGSEGGRHFLSMEYIKGQSLARQLKPAAKSARLPVFYSNVNRMLMALRDVARALHHAHSNQPPIVHRDVKPQNILLDQKGRACLVDFGLAREMTPSGVRMTTAGVTKGTPCYMAPEQALGRVREIGAGTDVWALGAILYEFLAGRPPFSGATDRDILNQVVHEEPKRPSEVLKAEGRVAPPQADLERICLQALQKDRSKRYATAEEFALEIDRFLSGRTVQARISSGMGHFVHLVRRRKALSAAITAAVVMSGVSIGLLFRSGPTRIVERRIEEKDPLARLSKAAREVERLAADFQYDLALRKYQELIDAEVDSVERGLLRQRQEDVRLQRLVLEGLVERIQKEPRDYDPFRLKTGLPESGRVVDATMQRLLLRRRSGDEEAPWGRLDPRQFASLVRDYWPGIEGLPALGFAVWCLRQGLTEEAASLFKRQSEPQAQRYMEELTLRSRLAPAPADSGANPEADAARDRILRQAEEALAKGDTVIARARFERVLTLRPADPDAASGLRRTAELERSVREADKPAPPEPAPAPAPAEPLPSTEAKPAAAAVTPEQIRAYEFLRAGMVRDLRTRRFRGAASSWLTALGKSETDAALFGAALNRIAGGQPAAVEVQKALKDVEKRLGEGQSEPELALRILFDLRDLFSMALVYGEVEPAVERILRVQEVIELQSISGKIKLGTLERTRNGLFFNESVVSGGQKGTIGWPVHLWGGTGRLDAVDLVALVRKDRNKRAQTPTWRSVLGEGLVLLYEGAVPAASESPELLQAVKLAPEEDLGILRMPEYLRLSQPSASRSAPAERGPDESKALLPSGLQKNAAGDYRGAIADFTRAISLQPSEPQAYYYRAFPKANLKDFPGALADCDLALKFAPAQSDQTARYHSARGWVRGLQGNGDGAIADYSLAIASRADFAEPYRGRGLLVHQKGNWSGAIADLTRAMQMEPHRAEDHFARGRCHYDAGRWEEAATDCRRAIELGVGNEDYARLYLWMSLARAGQSAPARNELKVYASRRSDAVPQVPWFKKVAALLTDDLTEEALLRQAEAERDLQKRREYLCEACFYAGTKRLLAGDKAGAALLFQRSLDTWVVRFMEYTSSQAELERLGKVRPAPVGDPAPLPAAWESIKGSWYYRTGTQVQDSGVLEIRVRGGVLLGLGWVKTDREYSWLQVGVPVGDVCRWIFINQLGEQGETVSWTGAGARTLEGSWIYRSQGRAVSFQMSRPATPSPLLDAALSTLANRSEKDFFPTEAEARAWIARALVELRR